MRYWIVIGLICLLSLPTLAQGDDMLEAQQIDISASDDLNLVGDLYLPEAMTEPAPAVILMHMLGGNRSEYDPLIPYLVEAGYAVLNVDLRGHGATGGSQDWDLAIEDTQRWFDWLRQQEGIDAQRTAIIGASIGSNVALIACANDEACVTAIALSPGEDYRGVMPADAVANGLNALLIASHNDRQSADSVRAFFASATGFVDARLYTGRQHGTQLFATDLESVANVSIGWLEEQFANVDA